MKPASVTRRAQPSLTRSVFEHYGPQLGEMLWYDLTVDPRIAAISTNRLAQLEAIIASNSCRRVLEVAPFAHYTGHMLSKAHDVVLCDISARSLRVGADLSAKAGCDAKATMVAADFHSLPFENGAFDLVFIASAIHHTHRPGRVLSELARVLSKGGLLYIFNEPLQRRFSFYKFRANRMADLGPTERQLQDRGVLRLVTSFLAHSRPEELFGMVENNRIPLATFLRSLKAFDVVRMNIDWRTALSDFDQGLAKRAHDKSLRSSDVAERIRSALSGLSVSRLESVRGVTLPSEREIKPLANTIARALSSAKSDADMADIFGGALQLVARKRTGVALTRKLRVPTAFQLVDGVYCSGAFPIPSTTYRLNVSESLCPHIQVASEAELRRSFPEKDWRVERSARGIVSLAPTVAAPVINVSHHNRVAVLIRFFAHLPNDVPYLLTITPSAGDNVRMDIAAPESRLARFVATDASAITFGARVFDGSSSSHPPPIRIQAVYAVELIRRKRSAA